MIRMSINFFTWFLAGFGVFIIIGLPISIAIAQLSITPEHTTQLAIGMSIGGAIGCGIGNGIIAAVKLR